jgi:hypothetical protein
MSSRSGSRFHVGKVTASDINNELVKVDREIRGKVWLKAELPTDGSLLIASVSDETGGHTLAFFDGTDWRRAQDLTVVS